MRAIPMLLTLVLCAAVAPALRGQTVSQLAPGSRVRIVLSDSAGRRDSSQAIVGSITSAAGDTLFVATDASGKPLPIPLARVMAAYRSAGLSWSPNAAGPGLLIGAVGGALLGYATGKDCSAQSFICFSRGEMAGAGAGIGGALGLVIGLAVGRTEKWSELPPQRVTMQPGGRGMSLSVAF